MSERNDQSACTCVIRRFGYGYWGWREHHALFLEPPYAIGPANNLFAALFGEDVQLLYVGQDAGSIEWDAQSLNTGLAIQVANHFFAVRNRRMPIAAFEK